MKQRFLGLGVVGLLLVTGLGSAGAQQQPNAATVAAWVQAFYDQTTSMNARFRQRYRNRVYDRVTQSQGRVRFRRAGMLRFDYDEPNGKIVVSDGTNLTVYEPPDAGSQRGQYFQQPVADSDLPAALSFMMGTGNLGRDFRLRLLRRDTGFDGQVLDLRSRRPSPHYSRILLYVSDDPRTRGVVHTIVIIDHSQNTNRFDFTDRTFNRGVPASVFSYRPPANARRVQP